MEDMCDAFGSKYDGANVGTFGDVATLSFYPAHHITTGEGGAVLTNKPTIIVKNAPKNTWTAENPNSSHPNTHPTI